jgi:hypothetical protein
MRQRSLPNHLQLGLKHSQITLLICTFSFISLALMKDWDNLKNVQKAKSSPPEYLRIIIVKSNPHI